MEKAREFLEKVMTCEEAREVSQLTFPPHRPYIDPCFYEVFAARGVHLDLVHPDSISCSFKVPPRLLDINGNLAMGAITTLIDFLGEAAAYRGGRSTNVSTDMSISRVSTAKLGIWSVILSCNNLVHPYSTHEQDELEIISRCLGRRGSYTGTHVLIRNKITGEIVAEGRHSVFDPTVAAISKL